ncbi:D-ala D-ala ligase C-terminus [Granulicatella balaenopterae]|uniref:D-ala D-ala ligase C-terminus n=1 Tax=Granulicatella balaenopterae TaxID=137733 RepID=A0A1H9KAG2_9LACT|nr:hypothetical protein [Granulicatella balaenopterae]SEQ95845.1 D-ala D-ala ligase C-terminus [Granulicatella balaenopterae]
MYKRLKGKKLIVLGATAGEINLIKRAQELGIYVIAADYNTDYTLSPGKLVADEAWDISWSDIDELEKRCIAENVDGAIAGYSEFRIDSLIQLCERLDYPCYSNKEQLEITRDKKIFKDTCRKYAVPTVKEYSTVESVDKYPVIVKPVDRAGSIGISIANSKEELEKAYQYAMDLSVTKEVIIEEYIYQGGKIDLYYAIQDGEIKLISSCDTINAKNNGFERVVQSAWLYPCRNEDKVLEKSDNTIRKMIQGMGIKYGCIFFSGFYNEETEDLSFFECGFRLEGGHQSTYVEQRGPFNYLDIFLNHALLGETKDVYNSKIDKDLKCLTINLYGKKGVIKSIKGFEELDKYPECTLSLCQSRIGESCDDTQAILNKLGMFAFSGKDSMVLKERVEEAYKLINILDENNQDMIYDKVQNNEILNW